MTRRNLELALLCIAAPLVILLFAMIALGEGSSLSWENLGVPVGIFIAFLIAHLAIRKLAPGADPALLPLSFALSGIGIAFVTRLAPELAMRQVFPVWRAPQSSRGLRFGLDFQATRLFMRSLCI